MESRLTQLLASFARVSNEYTLARLEFALRFPERESPPVLARLLDTSERTVRREWDAIEAQLEAIGAYLKQIERQPRSRERSDPGFNALVRGARELDQYARALRWVLTVTEKGV
jgi:hypothetical protein